MKDAEHEDGAIRFNHVLVFSPNWVGDTIMATPLTAALRQVLPHIRIVVAANPVVAPLWQNNPHVNELWEFGTSGSTAVCSQARLLSRIKGAGFDIALLLSHDFGSAIVAWAARIPVRVGYNVGGRGFLFTHSLAYELRLRQRHMVENYLDLLRGVGLKPPAHGLALKSDPAAQAAVNQLLEANGIQSGDVMIGLAPGAAYGPAKRWLPERFAELSDRIVDELGCKPLLFIGPKEMGLGSQIKFLTRHTPLFWDKHFSLAELAALIERCRLLVANDSGPMHMAAAVGTRVVAIFGSTSPAWTAPRGEGHLVLKKPLTCSPCFQRRCPLKTYDCLQSITVTEVCGAIAAQLRIQEKDGAVPARSMPT